jgi:hypothetical protein
MKDRIMPPVDCHGDLLSRQAATMAKMLCGNALSGPCMFLFILFSVAARLIWDMQVNLNNGEEVKRLQNSAVY